MTHLSYSTVEAVMKQIVADAFEVAPSTVTGDLSFTEDLHGDSLDIVELMMRIEDEFNIHVNDDEALQLKTVKEAIDYVAKLSVAADDKVPNTRDIEDDFKRGDVIPEFRPFNYREEIITRIKYLVKGEEGFASDHGRWEPVKELLFTGPAKVKGRAKLVKAVTLVSLSYISDEKLLDVYESVVRRFYTMR